MKDTKVDAILMLCQMKSLDLLAQNSQIDARFRVSK